MCTGFVKRGEDVVCGYNLDMGLGVWDYKVYARADMFYIGIKVGSRVYKTHGVNAAGCFANLPYMNAPGCGEYRRGSEYKRLDLIVNDYIAGKLTFDAAERLVMEKQTVNVPNASMHALFADGEGRILLVEPGLGYRRIYADYAVISNFPIMAQPDDLSPAWYGKDRYDVASRILERADGSFSARDGMRLLEAAVQGGEWATRVSFVYSRNENAVYYALDGDFSHVEKHAFK